MTAGTDRVGNPNRRRLLVVALAVVSTSLAIQLSIVAHRTLTTGRATAFPAPYSVGDTVRFLEAGGSGGEPVRVSLAGIAETATVVYAFHSECVHCLSVAPAWAEHFAASGASSRTHRVAVTQEDSATAARYAARFGWNVKVLSLAHLPSKDRALLLVSRTPWVFVFDSVGVLRHHGHGSDLAKVDEVLESIAG